MNDKNKLGEEMEAKEIAIKEAVGSVPQDVMENYDRKMDKKTRDNMERFAEFMARMIEKYGRKVLKEIEKEQV